ncbi:MAG: hypothetical protein ACKVJU_18855 [Verrucomicrobiales bacterium]
MIQSAGPWLSHSPVADGSSQALARAKQRLGMFMLWNGCHLSLF